MRLTSEDLMRQELHQVKFILYNLDK
jgi:hypothetical protein